MDEQQSYLPVTVDGKSAVVIGGTSGIGRAIALGFAQDGADVIATSRNEDRVAETAAELRDLGAETAEVTCDVTDRASLEAMFETAVDTFGDVDVLVNSPAYSARYSVQEMPEEEWNSFVDVGLTGVFRAVQEFERAVDDGSIITISSISAWYAREERPASSAVKSGVNGFTRAAAADLGPAFRINAIAPGWIETPLWQGSYGEDTETRELIRRRAALDRVGQTEEVVGAAIYLGSDAASYTTGEVITVDGGYNAGAAD